MRRQRLLGVPVLAALAVLIAHHVSSAQVNGAAAATNPAESAIPGAAQDHPTSTADVLVRMDSSRQTVRRMLEAARSQRDVIKTLCVDDKLNQVDVAIRNARDRKNAIEDALKKNDLELAARETTALNVLQQRVDQLVAEANTCISKEAEVNNENVGPTGNILAVDPDIADERAYYPPGIIIIEPPPNPSVFK